MELLALTVANAPIAVAWVKWPVPTASHTTPPS